MVPPDGGGQGSWELLDRLPHVAWTATPDGAVARYNQAWWDGAGDGAAASDPWTARVHADDSARCEAAWARALADGTDFAERYRYYDARHGGYRWHLGRATAMRDSAGVITAWLGTSTDVQELASENETLAESDRRKDEFLALLGHELRNPLAAMVSALELLEEAPEPDMQVRAREVLHRQLRQLERMVDDLLEVTRVARGRIDLAREPVRLEEVLEHAAQSVRPAARARLQNLRLRPPPAALEVYGDPTRLQQLFTNILANAVKYTEKGGRIEISSALEDGEIVTRIEDDGAGIDPELLPVIFEPFTQSRRTVGRSEGGLGLGLALVKKLAELHGGSVTAHSEGRGKGSTFTVRLPARLEQPALSHPPPEPAPEHESDVGRVLVVDDNEDAALGLSIILKRWGFEVRTAHDGETALSVADSFLPGKVLLDIGLPRMNGWDVAKQLRQNPRTRGALLIALTGYGSADDRRRSRESGFDHHLVKPADAGELRKLLVG